MMDERSRELLDRVRAVIAERDALRTLPVIATCGSCGWARDGGLTVKTTCEPWGVSSATVPAVLCSMVTHNSAGWRVATPHLAAPPEWCPMRKGER